MSFVSWVLFVALAAPDAVVPSAVAPSADGKTPSGTVVQNPSDPQNSKTQPTEAPKPPPPTGAPPAAKLECTPNPIHIGEALVCILTVIHRQDVSITVSAPAGIVAEPSTPSKPHLENKLETTRRFVIRPDSMRRVRIDNLVVIWTESSGGEGRLPIASQRIPVESLMNDLPDPHFRTFLEPQVEEKLFWDNHGPLPYLITNWPLIIVLMVLGGGGLGIGLGFAVRRWLDARRIDAGPPIDPRPAHVIALHELELLIAEDLPGQGLITLFYVRVSEIFRAYLERRFGINGLEMTSGEIRRWLETTDFQNNVRHSFDDFLGETDLVKFADFSASDEDLDRVTGLARELIELTRTKDEAIVQEATAEPTNEVAE